MANSLLPAPDRRNLPAYLPMRAVSVRTPTTPPVVRRTLGAAGWFFVAVILFMAAGLLTSL